LEKLKCASLADRHSEWVTFLDRDWLYKRRSESLTEIVGYQIAEALDLPIQPWLGFIEASKGNKTRQPVSTGILVARWLPFRSREVLSFPSKAHPDSVARALALFVFDGSGEPMWMMNADFTELRLFDLELVGPELFEPKSRTRLKPYTDFTPCSYKQAQEMASKAGLDELFGRYVCQLLEYDLARVVDLSGHPQAGSIQRIIVRGLASRQRQVRRILAR